MNYYRKFLMRGRLTRSVKCIECGRKFEHSSMMLNTNKKYCEDCIRNRVNADARKRRALKCAK